MISRHETLHAMVFLLTLFSPLFCWCFENLPFFSWYIQVKGHYDHKATNNNDKQFFYVKNMPQMNSTQIIYGSLFSLLRYTVNYTSVTEICGIEINAQK